MMSTVDGGEGARGSPKSRRKEQNLLICDSDKEGDVIYGSPLTSHTNAVSPC